LAAIKIISTLYERIKIKDVFAYQECYFIVARWVFIIMYCSLLINICTAKTNILQKAAGAHCVKIQMVRFWLGLAMSLRREHDKIMVENLKVENFDGAFG
jgi:hypothetical protein